VITLVSSSEVVIVERFGHLVASGLTLNHSVILLTSPNALGSSLCTDRISLLQRGQAADALSTGFGTEELFGIGLITGCSVTGLLCQFFQCLLLVVVSIDQHAHFAVVAPLTNVLSSFALDDLTNLSICHAFSLELRDPLWQLVGVTY